jgi:hypothetical protein
MRLEDEMWPAFESVGFVLRPISGEGLQMSGEKCRDMLVSAGLCWFVPAILFNHGSRHGGTDEHGWETERASRLRGGSARLRGRVCISARLHLFAPGINSAGGPSGWSKWVQAEMFFWGHRTEYGGALPRRRYGQTECRAGFDSEEGDDPLGQVSAFGGFRRLLEGFGGFWSFSELFGGPPTHSSARREKSRRGNEK